MHADAIAVGQWVHDPLGADAQLVATGIDLGGINSKFFGTSTGHVSGLRPALLAPSDPP